MPARLNSLPAPTPNAYYDEQTITAETTYKNIFEFHPIPEKFNHWEIKLTCGIQTPALFGSRIAMDFAQILGGFVRTLDWDGTAVTTTGSLASSIMVTDKIDSANTTNYYKATIKADFGFPFLKVYSDVQIRDGVLGDYSVITSFSSYNEQPNPSYFAIYDYVGSWDFLIGSKCQIYGSV